MTPTFSDFFKSFYYSNTYVPSVDLSEQGVSRHLLENENPQAAAIVQRLISPDVQQILSEPLIHEAVPEINVILQRNAILQHYNFMLLSSKSNLQRSEKVPSVIEHDALRGWIIKSGAIKVPKEQPVGPVNDLNEMAFFTGEESLLRIEMANRIQRVAQEANIDVVLPEKKLVAYNNLDGVTEPNKKYCVVCQKIDILSVDETVRVIKRMDAEHQREIARNISIIVQKAGLADASFDNIRLTPDGKLAFIDTKPVGLMVAKKPGLWNKLFGPKGASVEKCARIGLYTLMSETLKKARRTLRAAAPDALECEPDLESFREEVQIHYKKTATPKLSKWKIVLSVVSIGLIPLINAIIALVKTKLIKRTYEKLRAIDDSFQLHAPVSEPAEQERLAKEFLEKRNLIMKQFFAYIEGVPYKATVL